jgi:hypothetical protein
MAKKSPEGEAMMRAGGPAAILAASMLCSNGAVAACPPGSARNCVNLDSVPQISQQIVAKEHVAPAAKGAPNTGAEAPYTGMTVGVPKNSTGRGATVGYHWAFD